MAENSIGIVPALFQKPIPGTITPEQCGAMGIKPWELSDAAKKEIEAIEHHLRLSAAMAPYIIVG
jgi:hypothetical protein